MPRQWLSLNEHENYQDSNFKQLLKWHAEDDPVFRELLNRKNQNFTSSEIQNENLKEMSLSILGDIVEYTKNADFHSIMIDKSSDVSKKEQAAFCVDWVDENLFCKRIS